MAPVGACKRRRVPACMIVNSIFGPLNCNEYDSAFVATDANAPDAGSAFGLIHASTETVVGNDNAADELTFTVELDPLNEAALSLTLASSPGTPSVVLVYVPGF